MKKLLPIFWLAFAAAASAADLEWAGWTKSTADRGVLAPAQDLIVVVDSKPLGAATNVQVRYAVAGGAEQTRVLAHHGTANYDTHDRWTANLGRFPEGARIAWSLDVAGANQTLRLDDGGRPFSAIASNAAAPRCTTTF